MHREINPPEEILKRLLFVLYLAALVSFFVAILLGVVQQRLDYLRLAFLGGAAALALRLYGRRRLEFDRLALSFPHGGGGEVSPELRREAKRLLVEAAQCEGDWQSRQELRRQLTLLLDENPELWDEFGQEIGVVFPALAAWKRKS